MSRKGDSFRTPTAGLLVARSASTVDQLIIDGRCVEGNLVPGDHLWLRSEDGASVSWQIVRTMMYGRVVKYIPTGHAGQVILSGESPSPVPAAGITLFREDGQ